MSRSRRFLALALWMCLAMSAAAQTDRAEAVARARAGSETVVTGASRSARSGLTYVYLRPAVGGVEVADDPALVVVDDAGAVVYARAGRPAGPVDAGTDAIGATEATARAAAALGLGPVAARGAPPQARRVYVRGPGGLRLAYEVALYPADPTAWAVVQVDAATGDVLALRRLAVAESASGETPAASGAPLTAPVFPALPAVPAAAEHTDGASYLAFPGRSPLDGDRVLLRDPALALASPYGWHSTTARPSPEFTTTRGNNVHAFPDRDANGLPDALGVPDGGTALAFTPPLSLAGEPATYTAASVVNAFVWANRFHDVLYAYGFDEAAGNFQAVAHGTPGRATTPDPVRILVQNTSETDNAYMAVPPDGASPTMILLESTRTVPRRDVALDTDVLLHESAHGLTARLTGGPATTECLGTGGDDMAEGWSDWYALVLTMRADDVRAGARPYSAYMTGASEGARLAPYSAAFAVNGYTYGRTAAMTRRHEVGFVWATILWEVTWDLIDVYGFDPDISDARGAAGNQIALSLVTEALRLQPCRPGFVDARNAILYADRLLYRNAHEALLQAAFARRGLGRSAVQGTVSTTADNVEAFDTGSSDVVPPAPVTALAATEPTPGTVILTFAASGDDGLDGQATRYDIRYRDGAISSMVDFWSAPTVPGIPVPSAPGLPEQVTVRGLSLSRPYVFAVVVEDEVGNLSRIATLSFRTGTPPPTTPPPSTPPPVRFVRALADTLTIVVEQGATATGEVVLHNHDYVPYRVQARATGVYGVGGRLTFLRRSVSPHTVHTPYPTLGRGGEPVQTWRPFPGSFRDPVDAGFVDRTLPFPFAFGGGRVTSVRVFTDGYVSFVPGGAPPVYVERPYMPSVEPPDGIVATYWTDLYPAAGGEVRTGLLPDGRFAVEYRHMRPVQTSDTTRVSFVTTFAPSGEIGMSYRRISPGLPALIGIESADGRAAFVMAGARNEMTVSLLDPLTVLALAPADVVVEAGQQVRLRVAADASGLMPGVYEGQVAVDAVLQYSTVSERFSVPLRLDVRAPRTPPPVVPAGDDALRAWPNPASHAASFRFYLNTDALVRLAVFDVRGREVAVLIDGPTEAGWTDAVWTTEAAAAGLYVVRLVAGREVRTTTIAVVR